MYGHVLMREDGDLLRRAFEGERKKWRLMDTEGEGWYKQRTYTLSINGVKAVVIILALLHFFGLLLSVGNGMSTSPTCTDLLS